MKNTDNTISWYPASLAQLQAEALDALRAAGFDFDHLIYNSPKFQRHRKQDAIWYRADHGTNGSSPWVHICAGDYRIDPEGKSTWQWMSWRDGQAAQQYSAEDVQRIKQDSGRRKGATDAAREKSYRDVAAKSKERWDKAKEATDDHPYLVAKGVKSHGLRVNGMGELLIPVRDARTGDLWNLQRIPPKLNAEGKWGKFFYTGGRQGGCYYGIGGKPQDVLLVCEGFTTGAALYEPTGYPVAVALSCGNLKPVAEAIRKRYPDTAIVVCADDDHVRSPNPGLEHAQKAAAAVSGRVAVPVFSDERNRGTDFCDMRQQCGDEAVREMIEASLSVQVTASDDEWPEPQPLNDPLESQPYPIDALPHIIKGAVDEVQEFVQAPYPLVATCAIGAVSLACQAHINVRRAEKLTGPVSLFTLAVAESGERKSKCDDFFTAAIRQFEIEAAKEAENSITAYKSVQAVWNAQREGIQSAIKSAARKGDQVKELKSSLIDLDKQEPQCPKVPRIVLGDETPENLAYSLARLWPSSGIVSSEAGMVLGSHGMSRDSALRNLGLLNTLWDGGTHSIGRRTSDSFVVRGARLTVSLQVQEEALRKFFDETENLSRGTGFLARFLFSAPESTQGYRPFNDPPTNWPRLERFNDRIMEILNQELPLHEDGTLDPKMLEFTPEARAAWVEFYDAIEVELRPGRELCEVRDVASKIAENCARLAALIQMFEFGPDSISQDAVERAGRITAWHLSESRRFFRELAVPPEIQDATRLDDWLIGRCLTDKASEVATRDAQQYGPVRTKDRLDGAIAMLEEHGRAKVEQRGRKRLIILNPALLDEPKQ